MKRGGYKAGHDFDPSEDVIPNYSVIGDRVKIRTGAILFGSEREPLVIGDDVYINARCVLHGGAARLSIGNRVTLAVGVVIHTDSGPNTSPLLQKSYPITASPVTIEDDVWICDYAVILPGVRIGKGSVVGAHSVVKSDVAPGTVVAGQPARLIKKL
jgi:acetyltransferase-like isoleucine patch superfamily enzyme